MSVIIFFREGASVGKWEGGGRMPGHTQRAGEAATVRPGTRCIAAIIMPPRAVALRCGRCAPLRGVRRRRPRKNDAQCSGGGGGGGGANHRL